MGDESKHYKYSPSKLKPLELCPLYESSGGTNAMAEEGSKLHDCCYRQNVDGLTDEQKRLVTFATDAVIDIIHEHGKPLETHLEYHTKVEKDGRLLTEGTADVVLIYEDYVIVADYKFGYGFVSAYNNIQLQAYGAGLCQEFGKEKIIGYIIQPKLNYVGRNDVTLEYALDRIEKVIDKCESDDKKPNATEEGCKYCCNKLRCKAMQETQNELVLFNKQDIEKMTPEEVADIYEKAQTVINMCKGIETECKAYAEAHDGKIGNAYKTIETKGRVQPLSISEALQIVPLKDIQQELTISKKKVEDAYVDANYQGRGKGPTKKSLRDEFKAKAHKFIKYGDGFKKLVKCK